MIDRYLLLIALTLLFEVGWSTFTYGQNNSWSVKFDGLGSFSSPRVADLNGDGIGDIIIGAGRQEFLSCDSAVMALDGQNGEMLWKVHARDQIFGSAAIKDLNKDGVPDIIIGGRSAELKAINGRTGDLIWEFFSSDDTNRPRKAGWYNFYNPQFIPDQDGDGLEDILVSNGGDVLAEPYDPDRPAGSLLVISGRNGKLLSKAVMPDGKETYMSVAVAETSGNDHSVIFGTGGETLGGSLYVAKLSDVMKGDLSGARILATGKNKGFIAPPAWVDLNSDGYYDIVALSVDGRMFAFDGKSYEPLWETTLPDTEVYSSLAIGNLTGDNVLDLFVSVAAGVWPKLEWNCQFMVNGANGKIEYVDSLGFYQTSTPVVADFDGDGTDEILLSVNYHIIDEIFQKFFYTMLVIIDFNPLEVKQIGDSFVGSNPSSTPWIGDLDQDGKIEIIYCHETDPRRTNVFSGVQVNRIETDIPVHSKIKWGAYMGSDYNGVYKSTK